LARQPAGDCDVEMPRIETPGLAWDYWWSGACSNGLANGPGFLFEYMKTGGMGDVYAADMSQGRMTGEVTAYGPAFLATEWRVQAGAVDEADGEVREWRELDRDVPRHFLPAPLQDAIDRFARSVHHPQMPQLARSAMDAGPRCPATIHIEPAVQGAPTQFDAAAYIVSRGSYEAARKEVLQTTLELSARGDSAAGAWLRIASAVIGCKPPSASAR
jgi:hypothetical protein